MSDRVSGNLILLESRADRALHSSYISTKKLKRSSMADLTSKMVALLGRLRKEMNGAVADTMYYYGKGYGLNYGVSLPTIRQIAMAEGKEHEFAQYLYKQQVRELKLAALHLAQAERLTTESAEEWAAGVINSEMAEEMAFALLEKSPELLEIYKLWSRSEREMLTYSAMMAMARHAQLLDTELIDGIAQSVSLHPNSRPVAQGAVALYAALHPTLSREEILSKAEQIGGGEAREYILEELDWRLY